MGIARSPSAGLYLQLRWAPKNLIEIEGVYDIATKNVVPLLEL
jgi:hypothetical protein